ncbi:zinc finger, CCHC-type, retrotransposon gag domain protein [Tanacetum coccineum]
MYLVLRSENMIKKDFPSKKARIENERKYRSKTESNQRLDNLVCINFKRRHFGECRAERNECFRCGQTGHFSRDCVNPRKTCEVCNGTSHDSKDYPIKKPKVQPDRQYTNVDQKEMNNARARGRIHNFSRSR